MLNPNSTGTAATTELLTDLVYELLDAHCDTISLADEANESVIWAAHLSYLRDLQRVGRETLARVPVGAGVGPERPLISGRADSLRPPASTAAG